jgi:hypothetical protein
MTLYPSLTNPSGACPFGAVATSFEHLENDGERHMRGVTEPKILELWSLLAEGNIAKIEQEAVARGLPLTRKMNYIFKRRCVRSF